MNIFEKQLPINSKSLLALLQVLKVDNHESRLVGGCVRNALLGSANFTDIDIATTLLPDAVIAVLTANNIKAIPTGKEFGTITAVIDGEAFEITTLRRDIDHDGRHAKVEFSLDFGEDASRRDFTINALSYDPLTFKIYDYFSGLEDLVNRRVVFVGEPSQRIKEDYLRILRFFRFTGLFAGLIDQAGLEASIMLRYGLAKLSKERIKAELDKIIIQDNSPALFKIMLDNEIFNLIFPIKDSVSIETLGKAISFAKRQHFKLSKEFRYGLLVKNSITARDLLNLKFSRIESNKICNIISALNDKYEIKEDLILRKIWFLHHKDYLSYISAYVATGLINEDIADKFIKAYAGKLIPKFPINGHDLINIGITGENIKLKLCNLQNLWIASEFNLSKNNLLSEIAKDA